MTYTCVKNVQQDKNKKEYVGVYGEMCPMYNNRNWDGGVKQVLGCIRTMGW